MADPNLSVSLRNIDCMSDSSEEPDRISNFNLVKRFVYVQDKAQSVAYRAKIKKTGITKSLVHYMGWNRRHDEWVSNVVLLKVPDDEINNVKINTKNVINLDKQELEKIFKVQVHEEVFTTSKEYERSSELDNIIINMKQDSLRKTQMKKKIQ